MVEETEERIHWNRVLLKGSEDQGSVRRMTEILAPMLECRTEEEIEDMLCRNVMGILKEKE